MTLNDENDKIDACAVCAACASMATLGVPSACRLLPDARKKRRSETANGREGAIDGLCREGWLQYFGSTLTRRMRGANLIIILFTEGLIRPPTGVGGPRPKG